MKFARHIILIPLWDILWLASRVFDLLQPQGIGQYWDAAASLAHWPHGGNLGWIITRQLVRCQMLTEENENRYFNWFIDILRPNKMEISNVNQGKRDQLKKKKKKTVPKLLRGPLITICNYAFLNRIMESQSEKIYRNIWNDNSDSTRMLNEIR